MPRSSVPKAVIIEREKRVWALRITGATYEHIAKEIGITFGGVAKILNRLHDRYRKKNMDDIEKMKLEQIGQINNVMHEAYQAWLRSKENAFIKRRNALGADKDGKLGAVSVYQEERDQDGDPRYLTVFLKGAEDLRKIVGADAPSKKEITGRDGAPLHPADPNKVNAHVLLQEAINKALTKPTAAKPAKPTRKKK